MSNHLADSNYAKLCEQRFDKIESRLEEILSAQGILLAQLAGESSSGHDQNLSKGALNVLSQYFDWQWRFPDLAVRIQSDVGS